MLRSTGFFRGIECPLAGCKRPYCHFRHSRPPGLGGCKRTRETPTGSNDQGYDPFSPEVVRPEEQYNAEASDPSAGPALGMEAMELELVNRAIEAVRSEMEKDKKKLSQIGDQGYEPASSSIKAGCKRQMASASSSSHNAYDPGNYQMGQTADYNPTPRSNKYTLDSEANSHANSMEYVPTAVSKPGVKKTPSASRIPPADTASSLKCKYTLDNSKPSTDMEYDPLSNFSAKPVAKGGKDFVGVVAEMDGRKRMHPTGREKQSMDEEYVPMVKKPKQTFPSPMDPPKYTASFTESDEESSGTEYRPTLVSRLLRRKSIVSSVENSSRRSVAKSSGSAQKHPQETMSEDFESDLDAEESNDKALDKKETRRSVHIKSSKLQKTKKECKESVIKSSSSHKEKKGSSSLEKTSKKQIQESVKKEKSHSKTIEEKARSKERDSELACKEGKVGKSKNTEKVKGEKERGDAKKPKMDKVDQSKKESSKYREQKNGKLESGGGEKDKRRSSSSNSNKAKSKKSSLSLEEKVAEAPKAKPRLLSHADLFGDESPDEEDEEDERIVRKSASAFKRGTLISTKRKASDAAASSSEDHDWPEDGGGEDDEDDAAADDHDDNGEGDVSMDYASLQADVDYDSDPMEECLRIFNESRDVKTEDKGRQAKQPPREEQGDQDAHSTLTTLFPGQKKRVSHFKVKGNAETSFNILPKPQRRMTAQEVCYQRMQIAQQQAAQLAAAVKTAAASSRPTNSTPSSPAFTGEKKRVMHRPNPALISAKPGLRDAQRAGQRVLSPAKTVADQPSVKSHTSSAMLSKTMYTSAQKRVAHTPTLKSSSMKRPVIPTEFGAKVPTNIRQRYLNVFIDECLKFCPSEEVAFKMGLDEEKQVYERSNSKNIYLNVAVNTLKKIRSKGTAVAPPTTKKTGGSANKKTQSHEGVLGGRLAATTSYTINRMGKQQDTDLKGAVLYRKLREYALTEEQLQEHGYPRPNPERLGYAVIYNLPEKKNNDPFSKVCCRCGAEYKINAQGNCIRKEECNHHWGRLRRYRAPGGWETQYNCCSGAVGSPGCQVAKQHVQDGRKESFDGYVKTFSKSLSADGDGGVYALDCEMCYTKQGLELTRVTVINSDLKVIYDTFVKPESKVVDYNTRFSGVTEEDLENATMRLRDVQAVLLNMFSAESILIGHSLESDLLALKLLHSMVVDTAVVFPHRIGLPYKRALRNLMADYLKRIIQDNVEGHDSSEDASACMELMMWKIKEDAKVKR